MQLVGKSCPRHQTGGPPPTVHEPPTTIHGLTTKSPPNFPNHCTASTMGRFASCPKREQQSGFQTSSVDKIHALNGNLRPAFTYLYPGQCPCRFLLCTVRPTTTNKHPAIDLIFPNRENFPVQSSSYRAADMVARNLVVRSTLLR